MKKSPRQQKPRNRRKPTPATNTPAPDIGKRSTLRKVRNLFVGVGIAGGLGFLVVDHVRATMHEHDLTRVGNGTPSVVQIHDPQCPSCRALQKETLAALDDLGTDKINYVVANIRTTEGKSFANRYGVPHVTLLLFDKNGRLKHTLRGQRSSLALKNAFLQLL
ncbi:MAG: thioredoxin family protein [Pseudomonadota bacterium]